MVPEIECRFLSGDVHIRKKVSPCREYSVGEDVFLRGGGLLYGLPLRGGVFPCMDFPYERLLFYAGRRFSMREAFLLLQDGDA